MRAHSAEAGAFVELLVLLAIICILLALLSPALQIKLAGAKTTSSLIASGKRTPVSQLIPLQILLHAAWTGIIATRWHGDKSSCIEFAFMGMFVILRSGYKRLQIVVLAGVFAVTSLYAHKAGEGMTHQMVQGISAGRGRALPH